MLRTEMTKRQVSLKSLPIYWNTEWHINLILLEISESHEHSQVLAQGSPAQVRRAQPHLHGELAGVVRTGLALEGALVGNSDDPFGGSGHLYMT